MLLILGVLKTYQRSSAEEREPTILILVQADRSRVSRYKLQVLTKSSIRQPHCSFIHTAAPNARRSPTRSGPLTARDLLRRPSATWMRHFAPDHTRNKPSGTLSGLNKKQSCALRDLPCRGKVALVRPLQTAPLPPAFETFPHQRAGSYNRRCHIVGKSCPATHDAFFHVEIVAEKIILPGWAGTHARGPNIAPPVLCPPADFSANASVAGHTHTQAEQSRPGGRLYFRPSRNQTTNSPIDSHLFLLGPIPLHFFSPPNLPNPFTKKCRGAFLASIRPATMCHRPC